MGTMGISITLPMSQIQLQLSAQSMDKGCLRRAFEKEEFKSILGSAMSVFGQGGAPDMFANLHRFATQAKPLKPWFRITSAVLPTAIQCRARWARTNAACHEEHCMLTA